MRTQAAVLIALFATSDAIEVKKTTSLLALKSQMKLQSQLKNLVQMRDDDDGDDDDK